MTDLSSLVPLAGDIIARAREAGVMVATAESCTGGLVAALLTEIAGSSAVVDRGFVTYSNDAKMEMLGVPHDLLREYGAVSSQTAIAMAEGALLRSCAMVCVSITGIAGPGGGSSEKPVGLVHFAIAAQGASTAAYVRNFEDSGRSAIRLAAARYALELISNAIDSFGGISTSK